MVWCRRPRSLGVGAYKVNEARRGAALARRPCSLRPAHFPSLSAQRAPNKWWELESSRRLLPQKQTPDS